MMRVAMDAVTRIKTKTPTPYKLTHIETDTHDTKTFRFELPADATLDMLPGDFLYVHATINGKAVKRPYTPSSLPGTTGFFELTVKRYDAGSVSKYLSRSADRKDGIDEGAEHRRPLGRWNGTARGIRGGRHRHHADDLHYSVDSHSQD